MPTKRLEQIKNARSLNDIMDAINDLEFEFKNSKTVVNKLIQSISAEITIDHTGGKKKPKVVQEDKFVAPKATELQKHISVVYKLHDNLKELDAAEAMIKQAFAGNKKQKDALTKVRELKDDVSNSINDAFDALSEIAEKHMPSKMQKLVDDVISHMIDTIKSSTYKDVHRETYVAPDPEDKTLLHFAEYIGFVGLKDSTGFAYDTYYVVVTCVIDKKGAAHYHVNSFPDFKVPGRYPLGVEVNDLAAAKKQVDMLLSHNNFVTEFEKLPLPFDDTRAQNMGVGTIKGVAAVKIKDDMLYVTFAPNVKSQNAKDKITIEILGRLKGVLGLNKSTQVFKYSYVTVGGKPSVKFLLTPNIDKASNKLHFNLEKMNEAAEVLGLNDAQKKALRFALQS